MTRRQAGGRAAGALDWAHLDEAQRRLYRAIVSGPRSGSVELAAAAAAGGPLPGPFGPMLLDPPVGDALQQLGAVLRYGGVLDQRLREVAIVACAAACGSGHELRAHVPLAVAAGLAADEASDLAAGGPGPSDAAAAAVVGAVRALVADGRLDAPAMDSVAGAVGEAGALELVVLVGYYRLLASILATYSMDEIGG